MLSHIERGNLLPPMVVLQTLARNPHLKLAVVKEYMGRQLKAESSHIEEDRRQIAKYKKEAAEARKEAEELTTKVCFWCQQVYIAYFAHDILCR